MTVNNWLAGWLRRLAGHPRCDECEGIYGGCRECDFTGYQP